MSSPEVICNMALAHLGVGKPIAKLASEQSQEAEALRIFYRTAWKKVLRDFPWPFATNIATLTQLAQNPNNEWAYSYVLPPDCLFFRKIQSGIRNDTRQSRVPFRIANSGSGTGFVIFTDRACAIGEYTLKFENEDQWPVDFEIALSYLLASFISPRLTKGDPYKLGARCEQLYMAELEKAQANAFNEEQRDQDPESEYVTARDGGDWDWRFR